MDESPFATSAQQLNAQKDKNINCKALQDGTNVLKCFMDLGRIYMKPIFGALAAF